MSEKQISAVSPGEEQIDLDHRYFDARGAFLHYELAQDLISFCGACIIGGALHVKIDGVYTSDAERLDGTIISLCGRAKRQHRAEVISYLRAYRGTPVKEVSDPRFIPFKSHVYDIIGGKFYSYDDPNHDFVFLGKFAADYDKNAPELPSVLSLVDKIADGDNEVKCLLWEAIGYCLWRRNDVRGSLLLHGASGSNGKSTLLNLIEQFIGHENVSHLSLQDCSERFRLAGLYGKAVNLGDDIPASLLSDTSIFKRLATGEPVIAENKGDKPFSFTSFAKLIFACNALPSASDKSTAFLSRLIIVPLEHDFSSDADFSPALKTKKWSDAELATVCKYAVSGLRRVLDRGGFYIPPAAENALTEYRASINPIVGFCDEIGGIGGLTGQTTEATYADFRSFCIRAGHKNLMARSSFVTEVLNFYARDGLIKTRRRISGRLQYVFTVDTTDSGDDMPF